MDINLTYERLLPSIKKPHYLKKYEPSSSAIVFYWNINNTFKENWGTASYGMLLKEINDAEIIGRETHPHPQNEHCPTNREDKN